MTLQTLADVREGTRTDPRLHWLASAGDVTLLVLLVISMWRRDASSDAFTIVAVAEAIRIAAYMSAFALHRLGWRPALVNNLCSFVLGVTALMLAHAGAWRAISWAYVPFTLIVQSAMIRRHAISRTTVWIGMVVGTAYLDGQYGETLAAIVALSLVIAVITEIRWQVVSDVAERAEENHRQALLANDRLAQMQRQLIDHEKLSSLGLLAAGVAHEINNPMSYVTSNLNGLIRELETLVTDRELRREYREEVLPATLDGVRRVNTIVADLRRFARGDTERMVEFDANAEVSAAVRIARSRMGQRETDVDLGGLPPIIGRPQQLAQVVVNLLVNAAHASPPSGVVRVRTRAEGNQVAISVADDGVGIPPELRARLFEPFFTTKPQGEGTGLGLAVVHGIVSGHGGTVEVESTPNVGSTFTVRFPIRPGASAEGTPLRHVA